MAEVLAPGTSLDYLRLDAEYVVTNPASTPDALAPAGYFIRVENRKSSVLTRRYTQQIAYDVATGQEYFRAHFTDVWTAWLARASGTLDGATVVALIDDYLGGSTWQDGGGATGDPGEDGPYGGAWSVPYTSGGIVAVEADPGAGKFTFRSDTDEMAADFLIVSTDGVAGWSIASGLINGNLSTTKATLRLALADDPMTYYIVSIYSITIQAGYVVLGLSNAERTSVGDIFPDTTAAQMLIDFTGARGDDGTDGLTPAVKWAFFLEDNTDSDPGSTYFKTDNPTFASITYLFLDDEGSTGGNYEAWLATLDVGQLYVQNMLSGSLFWTFQVNGPAEDAGGYWRIPVTPLVDSTGFFATDQVGAFVFSKTGPAGADGADGLDGTSGDVLSQEYTAGDNVSGHRVLAMDDDGTVRHLDPTAPGDIERVVGISTNAASTGDPVVVVFAGPLTHAWSGAGGDAAWVDLNGTVAFGTAPTGLAFNMQIGCLLTTTVLIVRPGPAILAA